MMTFVPSPAPRSTRLTSFIFKRVSILGLRGSLIGVLLFWFRAHMVLDHVGPCACELDEVLPLARRDMLERLGERAVNDGAENRSRPQALELLCRRRAESARVDGLHDLAQIVAALNKHREPL